MQCKYYQILLGRTCEWSLCKGGCFIEVDFKTGLAILEQCSIKTVITLLLIGRPYRRRNIIDTNVDLWNNETFVLNLISYQQRTINLLKELERNKKDNTEHNKNKRRGDIEITENYICPQKFKTIPGNRMYASTTNYKKKKCIIWDSHIKHVSRNIFNDSINTEKSFLKCFSRANIWCFNHYMVIPMT